jgi:raffinose/stachyose/melibiose transport system permease protein
VPPALTLGLGAFSSRHLVRINLPAAAAMLASPPIVGPYLFFQRRFVRGMPSGALKG